MDLSDARIMGLAKTKLKSAKGVGTIGFIESVINQWERKNEITERQRQVLEKILEPEIQAILELKEIVPMFPDVVGEFDREVNDALGKAR